jgi:hypothetical protein
MSFLFTLQHQDSPLQYFLMQGPFIYINKNDNNKMLITLLPVTIKHKQCIETTQICRYVSKM